jgi:ribonuclease HI
MNELKLFTDGSVHAQSAIGYGAYLSLSGHRLPGESLAAHVQTKRFTRTSSTKLELQTLLWALSETTLPGHTLAVYTDSQNIVSLPDRRERYQQSDFRAKNNKPLNNADLYREFYRFTEQLDCAFIKVNGHQRKKEQDEIGRIFTLVDRMARHALRNEKKDRAR